MFLIHLFLQNLHLTLRFSGESTLPACCRALKLQPGLCLGASPTPPLFLKGQLEQDPESDFVPASWRVLPLFSAAEAESNSRSVKPHELELSAFLLDASLRELPQWATWECFDQKRAPSGKQTSGPPQSAAPVSCHQPVYHGIHTAGSVLYGR